MSRFFLTLSPAFLIVFTLLTITSSTLGTLSSPNPILTGFVQDCEHQQPCWYGIVPRKTTINASQHILRQMGYNLSTQYISRDELHLVVHAPQCEVHLSFRSGSDPVVDFLHFRRCNDVRLGDVISFFGEPDDMDACAPKPYLYAPRIVYRTGIILYMDGATQSPLQELEGFSLTPPRYFRGNRPSTWRGFAPDWHYARYRMDEDC